MIWLLVLCVAALTLWRFVKIVVSMFLSTLELSTLAQLGEVGTNQLYYAACANGAS